MGAVLYWWPHNVYDWIFLGNIVFTIAFVAILVIKGYGKYAIVQFMLGFAIGVLALKRSKDFEYRKEIERITGEKNEQHN
jgi:hypothetical protein